MSSSAIQQESQSTADSAWTQVGVTLCIVLAVAVIAFPSLYFPFGRDQGIHAYIAKLAGDGLVVYRDIFNVKPPMTTVVHWLSQLLFGETMQAIRLLDLIIVASTCTMLQILVTRHMRSIWPGIVAAVAYAVYHFSNDYWTTAQTDGWCSTFQVAAVLAYSISLNTAEKYRRLLILMLAGALIGVSFWTKYTSIGILLVFPAIHIAKSFDRRRIAADGTAVAAGFLGCILIGIAVLFGQGALDAFADIQSFLKSYVANTIAFWELLLSPFLIINGAKFATATAMLGIYAAFKSIQSGKQRSELIGVVIWLAAGYAAGVLQGKGIKYHFLQMYPPLAILAAVGVHALNSRFNRWLKRDLHCSFAIGACLLTVLGSQIPRNYLDILPVLRNEQGIREYWANEQFGHAAFKSGDTLALVDYLKRETLRCDRLFIWGYVPAVYYLAERKLVTRFIYNFPMFTAFYRQSYRDEFMAGLNETPPEIFVVEHEDRTPHVSIHNNDSAEVMEQFGDLKRFVSGRYTLRDRVARFDIYFRNDIAPGERRFCPAPSGT